VDRLLFDGGRVSVCEQGRVGADPGLEDDFLKEVGESLGTGTSAVVALVDFEQVDAAMEELDKFEGGRILRHTLSADVYHKLSEAVED